jgi:hypothetical protein
MTGQVPAHDAPHFAPNLHPLHLILFDRVSPQQHTLARSLSPIALAMAPGGKQEDGQGPWTQEARAQFMK